MFWDVAGVLKPDAIVRRARMYFNPIVRPGGLGSLWRRAGLADVRETSLLVRMDYADFNDYWQPIASGEASLGQYHASLDKASQSALRECVRAAFLGGGEDGLRSFAAVALARRDVV
jgi:hypothetical protein